MGTAKRVLVAGAGIGGLTLAQALERGGHDVIVLERARELRPAGAGITVQTNAMLALRHLGLDRRVESHGAVLDEGQILDSSGRVLGSMGMRESSEIAAAPNIAIHRARLQAALIEGLGEGVVRTGAGVRSFRETDDAVEVELDDGTRLTGDVLVGADGLHSVVRRALLGDEPPRYAGYTSWRGVSRRTDLVTPGRATESWGRGARFGIVPIGHGEVYWFATRNEPQNGRAESEKALLLEVFGDWHEPVRALIESTPAESILRTDICDRVPVQRWSRGRVVLLGDAAHPMTPNMGQGGGQAIEDAVVLADALSRHSAIADAFSDYERRRVTRANGFVTKSEQLGRVAQWQNGVAVALRSALLRATPQSAMRRQMRQVAAFQL